MRFTYSVVRFVPSPTRGEAVNIGLLLGSDESGEWSLELASRDRARKLDDCRVLPGVVAELERLQGMLQEVSENRNYLSSLLPEGSSDVSEAWLAKLADESGNIIQYSRPQPVIANCLPAAVEKLWPLFIIENEPAQRGRITKRTVVSRVKQVFIGHHLTDAQIGERTVLATTKSHTPIDFAIHNGRVVHLTQCWSFQVQDRERLLADVKSWAWTVRDLRKGGGRVGSGKAALQVDTEVPIGVVYVPPEDEWREMEEAFAAFNDEQIKSNVVTLEQANEIAKMAAEKLGLAASELI